MTTLGLSRLKQKADESSKTTRPKVAGNTLRSFHVNRDCPGLKEERQHLPQVTNALPEDLHLSASIAGPLQVEEGLQVNCAGIP